MIISKILFPFLLVTFYILTPGCNELEDVLLPDRSAFVVEIYADVQPTYDYLFKIGNNSSSQIREGKVKIEILHPDGEVCYEKLVQPTIKFTTKPNSHKYKGKVLIEDITDETGETRNNVIDCLEGTKGMDDPYEYLKIRLISNFADVNGKHVYADAQKAIKVYKDKDDYYHGGEFYVEIESYELLDVNTHYAGNSVNKIYGSAIVVPVYVTGFVEE